MKYIVHLYQPHGCDYTIACGHAIVEIEATKMNLREKVKEVVNEYTRGLISSVTVYGVTFEEEVDIDDLFAEDDAKEAESVASAEEVRERKMLDDLKKKYPDV